MRRRTLLVAGLTSAGAFAIGCSPVERQQLRGGAALPLAAGEIAINGWLKLAPDGTVGVVCPKSEMGQGVHSALLMLVAEELDCGWSRVRADPAAVDKLYGNVAGLAEGVPFRPDDDGSIARSMRWVMTTVMREMGFEMTGGSSSVKDLWQPMRQAAATMRATLVNAVAAFWQVPAGEVRIADGVLSHASGKQMTMGDVVRQFGATLRPATSFTLKPASEYKLIGQPLPRNDSGAKIDGSAPFGIDVRRPNMLYAAIRMCPTLGGTLRSFDDSAARKLPGVQAVLRVDATHGGTGGVVVVADSWWRAHKALNAVKVQWDAGAMAGVSNQSVNDRLRAALDGDTGFAFWKAGDANTALAAAPQKLQAEYSAPYLAHATLEPMNCTVLFDGSKKATVWAPTQVPGFARRAAAKALGIDDDLVELHVTYLGGGFGRRLEVDFVAQAAQIAKQLPGRAVQLLYSREEDTRHDFYRPACIARFAAGIDGSGRLVAWRNVSAGQAIVPAYLPRTAGIPGLGPDKTASEGAFDISYELPNVHVEHVRVDLPVPIGFWRAVGHSHQAFFKESFVDECAHAAKADPLAFRTALLARHPRVRTVLELAAARAGWGTPLAPAPDGAKRARGIALHESFGSVVAQVAEVSVGPAREIRVHRVVCAIDCGLAVNPNLIAQQMESGITFGLSAALSGHIDINDGQVKQGNFHDYTLLRFNEAPAIETHIVPSTRHPEGVGEPGLPPIAPAVANAVFVLTGQRLRSLPLTLAA